MHTGARCTVVIPTKNAMPVFRGVLDAVLRQQTPWPFDVLVIDSGSTDGTLEHARDRSGVKTISIAPSEFGHGRTRNQAIAACQTPYVALLTHDAQPVDENWLASLVAAVEQDERIAGAFGRHIAWPQANPFIRRDLEQHFSGFMVHPFVVDRDTNSEKFKHDIGWRQFLHFYSDNNSCLRRSVWERIPYPDVEFAEDQLWAMTVIERGYRKAYAPEATVFHSHEYRAFERLGRAFDEAKHFNRLFGYVPSIGVIHAFNSFMALSRNDIRYARATLGRQQQLVYLPRQIVQNIMLVAGHYLGTRHRRIPLSVQQFLSRDHKVFVGRGNVRQETVSPN